MSYYTPNPDFWPLLKEAQRLAWYPTPDHTETRAAMYQTPSGRVFVCLDEEDPQEVETPEAGQALIDRYFA